MIIDTHAHLYWDSFKEDFDEMIRRSLDSGVSIIINVGVDVEKSQEALNQVEGELAKFSNLTSYSTIGIHPHETTKYADDPKLLDKDISKLEEIYQQNQEKVIAVGECGLDYYFREEEIASSQVPRNDVINLQIQLFQAQIDLARKLNLPLIVHCRDNRSQNPDNSECWDKTLELIDDHPAILHCYSGLPKTTNQVLKSSNLLFSFAGNITYQKNENLRETIKIIPLEKILIETDCPFLPPQVFRGARNEPSFIVETAKEIAGLKDIDLNILANQMQKTLSQILKREV